MRFSSNNFKIRSWLASAGAVVSSAFRRVRRAGVSGGNCDTLVGAISKLAGASGTLDAVNHDLEERFLGTEKSLSTLSELAGRLLGESEHLIKHVSGQSGGADALRSGFDVLEAPLGFVEESHARTARLMSTLRRHEQQMDAMRRHETALGNAVAPLKYIQTMFRIESARLPGEMQGIFLGLTKEIEELHRRVGEIFGEQFRRLAQSREAIDALICQSEAQAERNHEDASRRRSQVRRTLGELQAEMDDGARTDLTLVKTSRGIAEQVAKIIVAMQFQDIVRQKIEHVQDAVRDMEAHQAHVAKLSKAEVRKNLLYHRDAPRLQKGQLKQVLEDLGGAASGYSAALGEIRRMALDLDQECVRLAGFRSVSTADDGMVAALLSALADARQMVSAISTTLVEIHKTLEPLGGLAANLTGVMRDLSAHIKLIALNAQIQASQVGTGTGLEILSENTTRISDQIYKLNEAAAAELDELIVGLNAAIVESGTLGTDAAAIRDTLNMRCGELEQRLGAYQDAARKSFEMVKVTGVTLSTETSKAGETADFLTPVASRVESLVQCMEAVTQAAAAALEDIGGADGQDDLSHLNRNYTMASERAVHTATFAKPDGVGTETAPVEPVEMFGEEAPVVDVTRKNVPDDLTVSAGSNSDVELF